MELNETYVEIYQSTLFPITVAIDEKLMLVKNISYYFNFFLMISGIIGNLLCIKVFLKKQLNRRRFNWYLCVLAIFEFFYCFLLFIDYSVYILRDDKKLLHEINQNIEVLMYVLVHCTDSCSVAITLLLSIDRLYAIQNPMLIREFITNKRPKLLIFMVFVVFMLANIPQLIIYYLIKPTDQNILLIYRSILLPIILNIIPANLIILLNTILIIKIINYDRSQGTGSFACYSEMKNNPLIVANNESIDGNSINYKKDKYITRKSSIPQINNYRRMSGSQMSHFIVIIVIAGWLLFTTAPYYVMLYMTYFDGYKTDIFLKIQFITSVLFNSNHCLNIIIYVCFHNNFRDHLFTFIGNLSNSRGLMQIV